MDSIKNKIFISLLIILNFIFLFLDILNSSTLYIELAYYLFYIIITLTIIITFIQFIESKEKIKENLLDIIILIIIFSVVFINYSFYSEIFRKYLKSIIIIILISRNIIFLFLITKATPKKNIELLAQAVIHQPVKSIITSYLIIIFLGAILLMMPFSSSEKENVSFINALFTSASAVCVTGLIVVDTATRYSLFGKIVIMLLIQIGGLGIMFFAYFGSVVMGRKTSLEDKMSASFLLNQDDMSRLYWNIRRILLITFSVEFIGIIFLFIGFYDRLGFTVKNLFFSSFHSISAFCNAGFSLFTNNLEDYISNIIVSFTICFLIVAGGLSFFVHINVLGYIRNKISTKFLHKNISFRKISLNTAITLVVTSFLIFGGMLIIYIFEHDNILLNLNIGTQYLAALFQSITLRTAGFNTISISNLHIYTYLMMMLWMFIGGASGSTAGGIKVNTVGVMYGYLLSVIRNDENIVLFKKSIPKNVVLNAFLITILSIITIFIAAFLLTISEKFELIKILFEVTSAFGTVGLSTGITPQLTFFGKLIIIFVMFIGKIGPLSLLMGLAVGYRRSDFYINYPRDRINIG